MHTVAQDNAEALPMFIAEAKNRVIPSYRLTI